MAKKMYQEAAEAYKEGSHDSAILLNKTGIAYHQMLQFSTAEKYYRLVDQSQSALCRGHQ